jgi:hypothetical protein
MVKKWMGLTPELCDICNGPLKFFFIDGRTKWGPWGIMCVHCHVEHGCGLGTGNGQKYDITTLEKVES